MKKLFVFSAFYILALYSSFAQPGYTNHAGNVVAGWPVALTKTQVSLASRAECRVRTTYPLSIFPESEQRRIAVDFGRPRIPTEVKQTVQKMKKAMERSRKRAEKGLCTKEESEEFCKKSSAALKAYLDRQVSNGIITSSERGILIENENL